MIIRNFNTFKAALRPYHIEGGLGSTVEKGYELFYGMIKPVKFRGVTSMQKAYKEYKKNPEAYDRWVQPGQFLVTEYLKKVRVYDIGEATIDRYTIVYPEIYEGANGRFRVFVGSCRTGRSFFQHGELPISCGFSHLGAEVPFRSLPDRLRNMVRLDIIPS